MIAKKPDWRDAKDYEFTSGLDRAGWAWEFLRRNPSYRSDYAAMLNSFSDIHKSSSFLRRSQDVVERGPVVLSREEALGEKWGMNRAIDPDGRASPTFRPLYPMELDWDSVQAYYERESDEAPIATVTFFSIMAFDLASDIEVQIEAAREILSRRSHNADGNKFMRRIQSQWTTYLRLLDAGVGVKGPEIIKHVEAYHDIDNDVYDNYAGLDRVSDHRAAAQLLCDEPLSILGLRVRKLPR